jgi:hypothetical protein
MQPSTGKKTNITWSKVVDLPHQSTQKEKENIPGSSETSTDKKTD